MCAQTDVDPGYDCSLEHKSFFKCSENWKFEIKYRLLIKKIWQACLLSTLLQVAKISSSKLCTNCKYDPSHHCWAQLTMSLAFANQFQKLSIGQSLIPYQRLPEDYR